MKQFIFLSKKKRILKLLCFGVGVCICFTLFSIPAVGGAGEGHELVSLNVDDMPLAMVLDQLSMATGYEFIVRDEWLDFPISASFDSIPLHRALKRMLADLDSAVIYGSGKKIKIIIYTDVSEVQETPEKQKTKKASKNKKSQSRNGQKSQPSSPESEPAENAEESDTLQDALDEYQRSDETQDESSSEIQTDVSTDQ